MAKNNKVQMPQSMGGLTRYFDEYKSRLEIKPMYVVIMVIVVILIIILLHMSATGLL